MRFLLCSCYYIIVLSWLLGMWQATLLNSFDVLFSISKVLRVSHHSNRAVLRSRSNKLIAPLPFLYFRRIVRSSNSCFVSFSYNYLLHTDSLVHIHQSSCVDMMKFSLDQ